MESFANLILNNAQTVRDGGLISSILQNVQILNNSNVKRDVMPYVSSARLTGGYVAALLFGILWILALISIMIYLFYLHCNKSKLNTSPNRVHKHKYLFTKGKTDSISFVDFFQIFAIIIFLIPALLLLCFCLTNISQIHSSIAKSAKNYEVNSTEEPTSILPAVKKSILHLKHYLSTFPNAARENTAPIVDKIIQATKDMQKETMTSFNKKLMRRLGVENTFKYGKQMTDIVVNFFDISYGLLGNKTAYDEVIGALYPKVMNPSFGLYIFITSIRDSFRSIPNCDTECQEFQKYFNQSFSEVTGFPDYVFATSFKFIMDQQNKTKQSVIDQTQHGKKEMNKTMAKTQAKMKTLLDIDGTIRNMTGETWTMMEHKFKPILKLLDNMTTKLNSEDTGNKASHYSKILVVLLITPIFLAIIVLIFALTVVWSLYCNPSRPLHPILRYGIYLSLILVSVIMLISTIMFLYGGKFETELCRYLRTNQPVVYTHNDTRLVLDKYINNFLQKTLPKLAASMPKSEFPLPKPKNVLYGLVHQCRKNEPILSAIQAIDTLDTAALSKPEVAAKFIRVGRQLLIESLNETDPGKMLPPDMKESLKQSSQLGMFKNVDIPGNIAKVSRTPIFISTATGTIPEPLPVFLDRIDKYFSIYAPQIPDEALKASLKNNHAQLLKLIEQFNIITDRVRNIYSSLEFIPPILPVVENLNKSLENMLNTFQNKTGLFEIANQYFDNIIVASTPKKAAGIMAKFGPKIMSKLGHCRPLFEAYRSVIDTTCNVMIMKLNVYWLYLGTIGLLFTLFLGIVYLTMLRTFQDASHPPSSSDLKLDKENQVDATLL